MSSHVCAFPIDIFARVGYTMFHFYVPESHYDDVHVVCGLLLDWVKLAFIILCCDLLYVHFYG